MKIVRNNYVLKFLSFISLIVLLLNIVNKVVYTHSHQLANGEIVTHAHPFNQQDENNEPFKSHEHTSLEFLILQALNVFLLASFLFVALNLIILFEKKKFIISKISSQVSLNFKQNKSPPFELVFSIA